MIGLTNVFIVSILFGTRHASAETGVSLNNSEEDWFTTGQSADSILGPLGFEESEGPSFLHHPG
jgi:hypothetical protein